MTVEGTPHVPLTSNHSVLVLVDHQVGLLTGVRDISVAELKNNLVSLAKVMCILKVPTVITTTVRDSVWGPTFPGLLEALPCINIMDRTQRSVGGAAVRPPLRLCSIQSGSAPWRWKPRLLKFYSPPAPSARPLLLWSLYQLQIQQVRYREMKLRDVIETMPTFACTALPDGSMQFVNPPWQEYTGLSSEKSVGSGWQAVVHPSDLGRHAEKWRASLAIGEPFEPEPHHRLTAEGQDRWFLVRGVPQQGGRGKIFKWYGIALDVEVRERAEETIGADAVHANRVNLLGKLAASLSHELKQPLAAAITNANAALRFLRQEQPDVEQACETTKRIIKNITRALEIIDRLWSSYKKSPPQRECIDVNASIRDMGELLGGEAGRCAVSMRTDLAADFPKVMADRVQLQQVLMNLMLNGIEAMEGTGGVLTVNSQLGQGGQVLISVSDTGVGLPAEKPDQIFNAFFTTKPQGSGMGLAVSRCIVESHGGHLWATANDERGATFHFTLPTTPPTEPEAAAFVARETGSGAGRPRITL